MTKHYCDLCCLELHTDIYEVNVLSDYYIDNEGRPVLKEVFFEKEYLDLCSNCKKILEVFRFNVYKTYSESFNLK